MQVVCQIVEALSCSITSLETLWLLSICFFLSKWKLFLITNGTANASDFDDDAVMHLHTIHMRLRTKAAALWSESAESSTDLDAASAASSSTVGTSSSSSMSSFTATTRRAWVSKTGSEGGGVGFSSVQLAADRERAPLPAPHPPKPESPAIPKQQLTNPFTDPSPNEREAVASPPLSPGEGRIIDTPSERATSPSFALGARPVSVSRDTSMTSILGYIMGTSSTSLSSLSSPNSVAAASIRSPHPHALAENSTQKPQSIELRPRRMTTLTTDCGRAGKIARNIGENMTELSRCVAVSEVLARPVTKEDAEAFSQFKRAAAEIEHVNSI